MWSSAGTGCRPVDEVGGESKLSADAPMAWKGRPVSRLTKPWSDLRDKGGDNLPCVGKIERMK